MASATNNLEFSLKSRNVSRRSYEFNQTTSRGLYSERLLPFSVPTSTSAEVLNESNLVNKISDSELKSLFGYSKQEALCVSAGLSTLSLSNMKRQQAQKTPNHHHPQHHSRHSLSAKFSDNFSQNSFSSPKTSSHDLNKEIERYTTRKCQRSRDPNRRSSTRVNPYLLDRPTAPLARVLMSSSRSESLPQSCYRDSPSYIQPVGEEKSSRNSDDLFTTLHDDNKENVDPSDSSFTPQQLPLRILPNFSHNHCPSPPRIIAKRPNNLINPSPISARVILPESYAKPVAKVLPYDNRLPARMAPEGAELDQPEFKETFRTIVLDNDTSCLSFKMNPREPDFDEPLLKRPTPMNALSQGEKSAFRPILARTSSPFVGIPSLHLRMATAE